MRCVLNVDRILKLYFQLCNMTVMFKSCTIVLLLFRLSEKKKELALDMLEKEVIFNVSI